MKRRQDWEKQLKGWINDAQSRPFVWGAWDCCLAMADGVRRMTDIDMGLAWRTYAAEQEHVSADDAVRYCMRAAGKPTFVAAVASMIEGHGAPSIPQGLAARGDIVMGESQAGPTWGLIDLSGRRAVFTRPEGLGWVPAFDRAGKPAFKLAWRVPY